MKTISCSLLILFCVFHNLQSQDIDYCREIILHQENQELLRCHIYDFLEPGFKTKKERIYSAYYKDSIHHTQGSFYGHLLHGNYKKFYWSGSLKEEGTYRLGLKHGKWFNWRPNGKLKKVETWKKGKLESDFFEYDLNGYIISRGRHKDGKVHGTLKMYDNGNKTGVIKYKAGEVVKSAEEATAK